MSLLELRLYINQQRMENPLIAMDDLQNGTDDMFAEVPLDAVISEKAVGAEESEYATGSLPERRKDKSLPSIEFLPEFMSKREDESFSDYLKEQILLINLPEQEKEACHYLIDCLNERGYLEFGISELAGETIFTEYTLMQALFALQSLEPAGVGARSLTECLILQLARSNNFNEHTICLVKNGLEMLARNDMRALARLLQLSPEKAQEYAMVVRGLNPIPSRGFYTGERAPYIVPDAAVYFDGKSLQLTMNKRAIPTVTIEQEYVALLSAQAAGNDDGDRQYLKEKYQAALHLKKAVEGRSDTLYRLLAYVAGEQPLFFMDGQTLLPMKMSDAARALDLHLSTISRAVKEKFICCQAGTVALKVLFTAPVAAGQGKTEVSRSAVKKRIQQFVEAEDVKNPLTDEAICDALLAAGFSISRRTVAKYREELGIEKTSRRRRL